MTNLVLVTGGTGRLGRLVTARLRAAGATVRVLSRTPGADAVGDLSTGAGLSEAVSGADVVLHCATNPKGDAAATGNLIAALTARPHFVYISVVGVDAAPGWGYTREKLSSERLVEQSGLPFTILRATQFFDYVLAPMRKLARFPIVPAPAGFPVQPVDAAEVADRLAGLTLSPPSGHVPDMAGPERLTWSDMQRAYLRATSRRRWLLPLWLPGMAKIRNGALLPRPGYTSGTRTFASFLRESGYVRR
ncbi:MAG TPA: SDR family oxidoreductase [Dactylosporangium sp.]|jgi:uncharacterized protein YbjT (DUF2867 family)|nr:SDR family oxidoreductase [Dactylosporangium sp.]